jgi:outer membrane protein OmpA-like peptidoglycan-associated protein
MKLKGILIATAALALNASVAQATVDRGWYMSLDAGASWVQDNDGRVDFYDGGYDGYGKGTVEFDSGWGAFATLGYAWKHWRLELELGYRSNDLDGFCETDSSYSVAASSCDSDDFFSLEGDFEEFSQMLNVLYDWDLNEKWTLSLGAGVGGDYMMATSGGFIDSDLVLDDTDYVFAYQLLAGLNYHLTRRLDLFLNYRYFRTDSPEFTAWDFYDSDAFAILYADDVEKHTVSVGMRWDLSPEGEPIMTPVPVPQPSAPKQFIVFFGFNKWNLTAEAQAVIAEAVAAAMQYGTSQIEVTGHTDTVGSNKYNQGLSMKRANVVKNELLRLGVSVTIIVNGKGETALLVMTGDGVKEPQNRRTTIDLQ